MTGRGARWRAWLDARGDLDESLPPVESLARAIGNRVSSNSLRVDLFRVVELWRGLRVSFDDLSGPGYLLDLDYEAGEILIRKQDHAVRQRFTLAHELGHWLLGPPSPRSRSSTLSSNRERVESIERWCDKFAASLLMPRDSLIRSVRAHDGFEARFRATASLPEVFAVSRETAWLRMSETGIASLIHGSVQGEIRGRYYADQASAEDKAVLVRLMESVRAHPNGVFLSGADTGAARIRGTSDVLGVAFHG